MLLANSKEVKICSEYIKIQLREKMYLSSNSPLNIVWGLVFFCLLTTGVLLKQDSLASNVSYLTTQIAINDLLEKENVIF